MNQKHISLLRTLWHSPTWDALVALREEMIANWREQSSTGATEFEYLKSSLLKDGKIEGVTAMLKSIESLNSQPNK